MKAFPLTLAWGQPIVVSSVSSGTKDASLDTLHLWQFVDSVEDAHAVDAQVRVWLA